VRILSFLISCQATPSISSLSCLPNVRPQFHQVGFFLSGAIVAIVGLNKLGGILINLLHSHTTEQSFRWRIGNRYYVGLEQENSFFVPSFVHHDVVAGRRQTQTNTSY
jgi:hypothetical protein